MRVLKILLTTFLLIGMAGAGAAFWLVSHYGQSLPDYTQLADYEMPVSTRVHAGDGRLLAEFATEKRVFVPISDVPQLVKRAFLSAEDKSFYEHSGLDPFGIARAILTNVKNLASDRRPVGASTITQQVAKNFLLTNEVSIERKIKEALLAYRIEQTLSKDRILELYLNQIYLGIGSYGAAAAALNYFDKSLDALTVAEAAYLAALPKAPNNYHPTRRREAAIERRNWVISRMQEDGHLSAEEASAAQAEPLTVRQAKDTEFISAGFFTEEVRRQVMQMYGEKGLYGGGFSVRTTLDPHLQAIASKSLRDGLIEYDRRHGWRRPVKTLASMNDWPAQLAAIPHPVGAPDWKLAAVVAVGKDGAEIGFADKARGLIPFDELKWARRWLEGERLGPAVRTPADVLSVGDVVLVEQISAGDVAKREPKTDRYTLRQIPAVQGALVAIDPHTGRVLAMEGGFSYGQSEFNRATQAQRQPGSAFKPFVYLAALESGLTPSTLVQDAPIELDQGPGRPKWRPENYSGDFYGPTPLRGGIEKSRNVMTVRLAQQIGMPKIVDYSRRFGIIENLQPVLSMSLGAGETTVLKLTTAYAMLVNGGKKITPSLIDRVQDRNGQIVWRHDKRPCQGCNDVGWEDQPAPELADSREQVVDPRHAYQMVSMLEGVVQRGTGKAISALNRPLAGKTGTTNDSKDAWFVGFSPDLAVGVFVGFDEPRSLGAKETGGSVSVPIFKAFMAEALKDKPAIPFRIPPGVQLVRVDPATGQPVTYAAKNTIWEAFLPGTEPKAAGEVLDPTFAGATIGEPADPFAADRAMSANTQPASTELQPATGSLNLVPTAAAATVSPVPAPAAAPSAAPTTGTGGLY